MIVTINSIENNSGLGLGVFSREGRMINSKFNEFQNSIWSCDDSRICEDDEDNGQQEVEDNNNSTNLITLKMVAHSPNKTTQVMKHPLAGHFNKSQLRKAYDGNKTKEILLDRLKLKANNPDYTEKGIDPHADIPSPNNPKEKLEISVDSKAIK